ncbi:BRCA1-associated protein [Lingula anatina]|uniref:BRCA1-associated protein n=1 Tax=Lingula anatina TaxID=7574 RepID=A0A1S3JNY0_LINAN|nr:BRCA1-associated protein [Lingula anatina]|eukprot:XP_013412070.1 BRCA1-associated protein [Lingula anatina]
MSKSKGNSYQCLEPPHAVSLAVLRFEIANHAPYLKDICYTAPYFKDQHEIEDNKTYAQAVSSPKLKITPEIIAQFRGRREFIEIIVETIYFDEKMTEQEAKVSKEVTSLNSDKQQDDGSDREQVFQPIHDMEEAEAPGGSDKGGSSSRTSTPLGDGNSKHSKNAPPACDTAGEEATVRSKRERVFSAGSYSKDNPSRYSPLDTRCSPLSSDSGSTNSRPSSSKSRPISHSPNNPDSMWFMCGNQRTEMTEGMMHFYKDSAMTPLNEDVPRSEIICMLAVPAALTTHDLMNFVAPVYPSIEHMRIIRDNTPNQYMVLIKFRGQKYADEFYKAFNNVRFNSIESDICVLVYVAKVEMLKESEGAFLPVSGLVELPKCPVCLERMDDSVDGILTILCNHSFHAFCLAKWGDTRCPVCRYVQTPEQADADQKCLQCGSSESLWICLICGYVGCGRYVGEHAYQHFQQTQHTYSMHLGNNRVWDYVGDGYVHRLVQNKTDGKLVEVDEGGNPVTDEKVDSLALEYTYFFTQQLDTQRRYFEEKIAAIEKNNEEQRLEFENRAKKTLEECQKLETELSNAAKEKQTAEKKCSQLSSRVCKLSTELQEEKEMNKCLRENQQTWQEKFKKLQVNVDKEAEKKNMEIADLKEQLRDVMFYLEAQQKLSSPGLAVTQEELQGGQVIVGESSPGTSAHGSRRSRKKGK